MEKLKNKFKSVRVRLFVTLCIVVIMIVLFLIVINNVVLESFYLYTKMQDLKVSYNKINQLYSQMEEGVIVDIENELNKIAIKNDFDILIENSQSMTLYTTDSGFSSVLQKINELTSNRLMERGQSILFSNDRIKIKRIVDEKNAMNYILLSGTLDNGNIIYMRIPIASIQESVKISNNLLILIGFVSIAIAGILASYISRKFTDPILELNDISRRMAKLDFAKKYMEKDTDDEINELGKNINIMSNKLEVTIKQLRETNRELEKDVEEKSRIDEMRTQFISDVSHELKTPIALIQGYAEGLIENVNSDEESRKFYAEVILDESNKMDRLVKQLLELMKLEYGKREFTNKKFNITELISEVIRKCEVMLQEKEITVEFDKTKPIYVIADDFYMDQVVTNYFTNAIKHTKTVEETVEKGGTEITQKLKLIRITCKENTKTGKIRIGIFNTGDPISEEELDRIWKRFYKIDSSRNRDEGGTGIGLALVKAIMNNYGNDFGVENQPNGVEFYFEIEEGKEES